MLKILFSITLIFFALSNSVNAELSKPSLQKLDQRLHTMTAPFGEKVGLCFIDLANNHKIVINADQKFPAASVAKMPVMTAAYQLAQKRKIDLNKQIVFKEEDKIGGSGVLRWMKAGNIYSIRNLIRLMISISDNTATKLVVEQLGYSKINDSIKNLGLKGTKIVDKTMLNEPTDKNTNLTTPYDMAELCLLIKNSDLFSNESKKEMLAYMKNQYYRWGICRGVPRGIVIANKTGNHEGVLNDVGIIYSPAGNYVLSIFTFGIAKKRTARELINKISEIVYQTYTAK
jgi:beta-lactamase class A